MIVIQYYNYDIDRGKILKDFISGNGILLIMNLFVVSRILMTVKKIKPYSIFLILLISLISFLNFLIDKIPVPLELSLKIISSGWMVLSFGILAFLVSFQPNFSDKDIRIKKKLLFKLPLLGAFIGLTIINFLGISWLYSIRDIFLCIVSLIGIKVLPQFRNNNVAKLIPLVFISSLVYNLAFNTLVTFKPFIDGLIYLNIYLLILVMEKKSVEHI